MIEARRGAVLRMAAVAGRLVAALATSTCARGTVPSRTFAGDLAVEGYDGHRQAAAFTDVTGSLIIHSTVTQMSLANLRRVGGDLRIDAADLTSIELPRLREVGGSIIIRSQPRLVRLAAPALTAAGGLTIADNPVLTEVMIPHLRDCVGGVAVTDNPGLSRLPWGLLARVGGELRIERNREILGVDLHAVEAIGGDLSVVSNPRLVVLQLESLTSVSGGLTVRDADALQRLRAPHLQHVAGPLCVARAGRLRHLEMPLLADVTGDVSARELPVLSAFVAPQLAQVGGALQLAGTQQVTLVDLAGLVGVGGSLQLRAVVGGSMRLVDLRLGSLVTVGGDLAIRGTALTTLSLAALAEVGGVLSIQDNSLLADLRLGSLIRVARAVRIRSNGLSKCAVARLPESLRAKSKTRTLTTSVVRADTEVCAEGTLSPPQIAAVVEGKREMIDLCFADAGATGHVPPGSYTARLAWRIRVDGTVTDARVVGPRAMTPAADCVARAMAQWRFAHVAETIAVDDYGVDVRIHGPWIAGLRVGDMHVARVLGQNPMRHDEAVTTATFTEDGRRAITGSLDGTLRIWDTTDGRLGHVLRGHRGAVRATAMLAPSLVLSSGDDHTLRTWELVSGRERARVETETTVTALVVAPDRCCVFGGDARGQIHRWFLSAGRKSSLAYDGPLFAFAGADQITENESIEVTGVALDAAGRTLYAGTQWGQIAAVRVADGGVLFERTVQGWGRLTALTLAPKAETVILGGGWGAADATLRIVEAASGNELRSLLGSGPVTAACLVRHGQMIAVADEVGVELYDATTWLPRGRVADGVAAPTIVAVSDDVAPGLLLVGRDDGAVELWNVASRRNLRGVAGHTDKVEQIRIANNGRRAVSVAGDGTVRLWDLTLGKPIATYPLAATAIAITNDGKRVAIADRRGRIALGAAGDSPLRWFPGGERGGVVALAFGTEGDLIALGERSTAWRWQVNTSAPQTSAALPGDHEALVLSDDGALAVSLTHNGLSVWTTRTGEENSTVETEEPATRATRFVSGGDAVLVVDSRSLWYWDLHSGKLDYELTGHVREILDASVAPRRAQAASVSLDGTLRHWDLDTHRVKAVVDMSACGGDFPSAVAMMPQGSILVGKPNGLIFVLERAATRH